MNLELTGQTIIRVSVSYTLQLFTDDDVELAMENTLRLSAPGAAEAVLDADEEYGKDPRLEALRGKRFTDARVTAGGGLALSFDDGTAITIDVDEDYESWNIVYRDGRRIVCMAGGELATWGPDTGEDEFA